MKRLSVYLTVFPLLGFTGPCMSSSSRPPSDQNETNDGAPVIPPGPPPPPIPEPEPVITEPPLPTFTCDQFPPLPFTELPSEEIIRHLTADETTYFWYDLFCDSLNGNSDPEGPPDCERLIVGRSGAGHDKYQAVIKFALTDLPAADEIENVNLDLYPLGGEAFFGVNLRVERLETVWWRACPDNQTDWRTLCGNELPTTTGTESASGGWWNNDENDNYWFRLDITKLYRDWQDGTFVNYGLMLSEANFFNYLVFASADNVNPGLRPRLVITTKAAEQTLHFPLDGDYEAAEMRRQAERYYGFGSWWNKYRCDENAPHEEQPSPRLRHTGVDWPAAVGEPVYAVRDGIVRYAQTHAADGGFVVVEHDGQWTSICTHVIPEVSESTNGQPTTVRRGEQIGSIAPHTLPHLHFQVRLELYDTIWSPIGRLPEKTCRVVKQARNEPGFPEKFIDPKCLDWE